MKQIIVKSVTTRAAITGTGLNGTHAQHVAPAASKVSFTARQAGRVLL